jgi:MoaA/NifB/PqqE/SkfB family radical SAM enzyme
MIKTSIYKKINLAIKYPKVAFNTMFDPIFLKNIPSKFPRIINVFVTEDCNFRCPMCHVVNSRQKQHLQMLSFQTIKKIADEVCNSGVSFQLSGGEPLLHPEIISIIKYLHSKHIPTGLVTNGLLLEKYAKQLVDSGLDFLAISLDGPDETTQFKRGYVSGSFEQIILGIKKICQLRGNKTFPNIRVATVINQTNFNKIDQIYSVFKDISIDHWSISHFFYYYNEIKSNQNKFFKKHHTGNDVWGQNIGNKKEYFTLKQRQVLKQKINYIKKIKNPKFIISFNNIDIDKYYSGQKPSKTSFCDSPLRQIFLRGNGDVEICHGFTAGNIHKQSLKEIWHNKAVNNFRTIIANNKTIPACFRCCALDIKFN